MRFKPLIFFSGFLFLVVCFFWWSKDHDKNGFQSFTETKFDPPSNESGVKKSRAGGGAELAPKEKAFERNPAQINSAKENEQAYQEAIKHYQSRIKPGIANFKQKNRRASYSQQLPQGDFKGPQGHEYSLLAGYHAVKKTSANAQDYPQAMVKNGFFIVEGQGAPGDAARVLKNLNTHKHVIFTGILKTRLKDLGYMDQVVKDWPCEVVEVYEHLNAVFYRFDSYEETLAAHRALSANPLVLSSEIELLEGERTSK